jgi:hypothetical protein
LEASAVLEENANSENANKLFAWRALQDWDCGEGQEPQSKEPGDGLES